MGAAGSDVIREAAGGALMADDRSRLTEALPGGHRTRRDVARNAAFILVVLVSGAPLGVFPFPVEGSPHQPSGLAVIATGFRLARQ